MAGFTGESQLTVDGRTWRLHLDFNALCEFEGAVGGRGQARLLQLEMGRGDFSDIRALLWALLRRHHPDMTLAGAGDLVGADVAAANAALVAAITAAAPEESDGGGEGSRPEKKTQSAATEDSTSPGC
ncbi:GTA-gp10 family protein [Pikeienuella sp. HZG-20]|uniref:GTA-gp10 family protein n=1 Tax=Paludibacillus litoralis TaxID=3133267 RepID=UPI0030ED456C